MLDPVSVPCDILEGNRENTEGRTGREQRQLSELGRCQFDVSASSEWPVARTVFDSSPVRPSFLALWRFSNRS